MKKGSFALRLFLYASLVSLVWLGGYVALSGIFAVPEPYDHTPQPEITPAVSLPSPVSAQWSVLAVTNEEQEVTAFLLRYADFLADTMVFIEVPVDTKPELVSGGYEVLSVSNPEIPELFMISDLCRIFSKETWCMAAEEVGAALLGVRPKECYFIEEAVYESITETVDGKVRFRSAMSVKDMIVTVEEHAVTNDTLAEEMVYWESYQDMDTMEYKILPGKRTAEEYRPDFDEIAWMVEQLQNGRFGE